MAPHIRPEKDKEVKGFLDTIRSFELYAPTTDGALVQADIPRIWGELAERFWTVAREIDRARTAAGAPANGPHGREVRDWPVFVRSQLSVHQLDSQLYTLHREAVQRLELPGEAKKDAKERFRSLTSLWHMRPHQFFLEFPGRDVAESPTACKILRGLTLAGHRRPAIWAAVRDAMLARHSNDNPAVPVPNLKDVKAAQARLEAEGPPPPDSAEEDGNEGEEDDVARAKGKGKQKETNDKGKRRASSPADGEASRRRRRLTRRSDDDDDEDDAPGPPMETGRGLSTSVLADEPSLLETIGGQSVLNLPDGPEPCDGAARRAKFRRAVDAILALPKAVPSEDSPMVAETLAGLHGCAVAVAIALNLRQKSNRYWVEDDALTGERRTGTSVRAVAERVAKRKANSQPDAVEDEGDGDGEEEAGGEEGKNPGAGDDDDDDDDDDDMAGLGGDEAEENIYD